MDESTPQGGGTSDSLPTGVRYAYEPPEQTTAGQGEAEVLVGGKRSMAACGTSTFFCLHQCPQVQRTQDSVEDLMAQLKGL